MRKDYSKNEKTALYLGDLDFVNFPMISDDDSYYDSNKKNSDKRNTEDL